MLSPGPGRPTGRGRAALPSCTSPPPSFQWELKATAAWASDFLGLGGSNRSPAVKTQPVGPQTLVFWAQGTTWHLLIVPRAKQEVLATSGLQTCRGTVFVTLWASSKFPILSLILRTAPCPLTERHLKCPSSYPPQREIASSEFPGDIVTRH